MALEVLTKAVAAEGTNPRDAIAEGIALAFDRKEPVEVECGSRTFRVDAQQLLDVVTGKLVTSPKHEPVPAPAEPATT